MTPHQPDDDMPMWLLIIIVTTILALVDLISHI
mgnify:CR=1 FL=1